MPIQRPRFHRLINAQSRRSPQPNLPHGVPQKILPYAPATDTVMPPQT